MNPSEADLKVIFCDALNHPVGAERAAYLDRACANEATLRLQVESLLKAHDDAGGFLGSAVAQPASAADATRDPTPEPPYDPTVSAESPALAEGPGTTIGPYKLLQKIGEGGMGAVFMAEQEKPVRRKVALKVIKPGMDTARVIARFEAERQALAIMEHANIARVLDAGATESGRPFFVMELVKGVPITEYCDRNHLTPGERLELFIPVCQAIQHAHQKGIIHRDIKPSNVLVTLHDGTPVPKVIDFGVAKAIDQRLTEKTLFTEFGAVIGTLEYMSPEQAEMGALDIDTRSDIYSLGVMLYELLTGSTPLERSKLRQMAYSEILRRIRDEEPMKPSTRLSESKDSLPSISAQRKMEPARLTRLVSGDLDWIVMKSLEKDRTRRYETATGFAKDVRRYLDGDPVEACPPSAAYKLRKFARKHRAALATAGAFAFLLVVATAVSIALALWVNRERVRAVIAEKNAREQQSRAQDREQMAIDAVKRFGDVVRDTPELKNNPALSKLRAMLLKEPQAFFRRLRDRLQSDKETTTGSLGRLAKASFDLGDLTNEIGNKQEAVVAFEESLATMSRLVRENPSATEFQSDLARTYSSIGGLQSQTGRPAEAMASYEKARAIRERLAHEHASVTTFQSDLAASHHNIGLLQSETGLPALALASYEKARSIRERLTRENPSVTEFQSDLAESHTVIGNLQSNTGRAEEAFASYEAARTIWERLARDNPSSTSFQSGLAAIHNNIGGLSANTPWTGKALEFYENACAIWERLALENPSVTQFQSNLALIYYSIGVQQCELELMEVYRNGVRLRDAGREAKALGSFERARAIQERLARENPSVTEFQSALARTHNIVGLLQKERNQSSDALKSLEQAALIQERLAREHSEFPDYASEFAGTLSNMAIVDLKARHFDKARQKLMRAVEWQRKALAANPDHPKYREFLENHLGQLREADDGLERNARLTAVLRGQATKNDMERIELASWAYQRGLHSASARLYAEAFAHDSKLVEAHGYNAACAAALAGCGQGKDEPHPDDAGRAQLRRQALTWLQAELAARTKILDAGPAELKTQIVPTLQHWKADSDLAGIRDETAIAKLPEVERAALTQFWKGVDDLITVATNNR